jgi:hypothetical protein
VNSDYSILTVDQDSHLVGTLYATLVNANKASLSVTDNRSQKYQPAKTNNVDKNVVVIQSTIWGIIESVETQFELPTVFL